MIKSTFTALLSAALLSLGTLQAQTEPSITPEEESVTRLTTTEAANSASIPDTLGRAGMVAQSTNIGIIAGGGANFPNAAPNAQTPEERGAKKFYDDVMLLSRPGSPDGDLKPLATGKLPAPVGYAATARVSMGMIIAGGCNDSGHLDTVTLVEFTDGTFKTTELPKLPAPVAYPAFAELGGKLYVMGGQTAATDTTASNRCFVLNTSKAADGWQELPAIPGEGRMLAAAGVSGGKIYLTGGCSLKPNAHETTERTYLKETLCFDPKKNTWNKVADAPETIVGAAGPMITGCGELFLLGGDPGSYYRAALAGQAPATHPGQNTTIYAYSPAHDTWTAKGNLAVGVATAPAVPVGEGAPIKVYVISGETAPGVRTPIINNVEIHRDAIETVEHAVLWTPWLAIGLGIVALLLALRSGLRTNPLPTVISAGGPGKWAWIAVAVLWVVVMLNYFDRQLLAVLNTSVTRGENGIAMTQAQFGMVTSAFLIVYAALSPVGGYLSDRFSRKFIIMCSLVVWSVVTWLTGKAETYEELLIARAAMGISEAFYIPAALALISDYHRGGTRSMATGLHMSGIYAGQILAGYGAMMAGEPYMLGWRLTFEAFGFVGVAYALIVLLFLRDPEAGTTIPTPTAEEGTRAAAEAAASKETPAATGTSFSFWQVMKSIFSGRAMYILLVMYACAGFANWFLMNWYPRLLQDMFGISEAAAGPQATSWINIAKFASVLGAAVIADRWYLRNRNARAYVPGIAFLIAGPCVMLAMSPSLGLGVALTLNATLALVSTQGIAQGSLDATLMPVLRSHIDERFSATGYGMLNLTSVGAGALVSWLGGMLMDMNIALSVPLMIAGVLMVICGLLFFALPKKKA